SPLVYFCPPGYNCDLFVAIDTTSMASLEIKLPGPVNDSTGYWYVIVGVNGEEITVARRTNPIMLTRAYHEDICEICISKIPAALKNLER
ncbi:hypothetical protein PFISCL1PPCAC_8493, partial [Pristionchus fissidentatus]